MGLLNIAMSLGVSSSMSAVLLFTNPLWLVFLRIYTERAFNND